MLVVVVPAGVQKLPHLDFQIQIVVVPVKVDILLMQVLFKYDLSVTHKWYLFCG